VRSLGASLLIHRMCARGGMLDAFALNRLSQNRRGRRAVAGEIASLARDFPHHFRSHVFVTVLQLDFFCNRHTVFGYERRAKFPAEYDIPALRAQRYSHRIGQRIDPAKHRAARVLAVHQFLCSHIVSSSLCFLCEDTKSISTRVKRVLILAELRRDDQVATAVTAWNSNSPRRSTSATMCTPVSTVPSRIFTASGLASTF